MSTIDTSVGPQVTSITVSPQPSLVSDRPESFRVVINRLTGNVWRETSHDEVTYLL